MNKKFICLVFFALITSINTNQDYSKASAITLNNQTLYSTEQLEKNASQAVKQGDYNHAAKLFEKLILQKPYNEELRVKYAYILVMAEDYDKARVELNKIISTSKNPPYISFAKGKLKEISNNKTSSSKIKITSSIVKPNKVNVIELEDDDKDHYLCNGSDPSIYKDESGSYFRRWEKEDLPIKVYIPAVPASLNVSDANKYINLIKKSMNRWAAKAPKYIQYSFVSSNKDANIIIVWHDYFKDESWGNAYFPIYAPPLKRRISLVNLAVRAQLSDNNVFFSDEEFTQIATHEVGHTLGLSHSYPSGNNNDLMAPIYRSTIPDNDVQISERDVQSLLKLYSLPKNAVCKCKNE